MRLLMLTYEFPSSLDEPIVSGEVKNPYTLYRGLIGDGHEVRVVNVPFLTHTVSTPTVRRDTAHTVTDIPDGRGRGVVRYYDRARQVARHLRRCRADAFDLVHAEAPVLALGVRKAGTDWRQKPLVVTGHGTNLPEANADAHANIRQRLRAVNARLVVPIDRAGFRAANSVVSVSEFQAAEMAQIYGVDKDSMEIIHNGVEFSRYSSSGALPNNSSILFVGRLAPKKGVVQLIEAMPLVLKRKPDASLVIVGGTAEFDFIGHEVIGRVRDLGLEGSVRIEMAVPEAKLPEFYSSCDVLVAPSEGYESLPTVILEAMAADRPVVATQSWGTPEALGDRHPGLLRDNNPATIAAGILKILEDPDARQICLAEQRARLGQFDSATYVAQHLELYARLIGSQR
jgi:glycosyltransferase involved in cell wall biosynthesis